MEHPIRQFHKSIASSHTTQRQKDENTHLHESRIPIKPVRQFLQPIKEHFSKFQLFQLQYPKLLTKLVSLCPSMLNSGCTFSFLQICRLVGNNFPLFFPSILMLYDSWATELLKKRKRLAWLSRLLAKSEPKLTLTVF